MALKELEIDLNNPKNLMDEEEDDIEIVEEDEEEVSEDEESEQEDEVEDDSEEGFEDAEEDEDEEEVEVQVKSRENDRVRSLVEQEKILAAKLNQELKEKHELKKKLIETQKTSRDTNVSILESHVKALKSQMAKAQEEGESSLFVDLNEKMTKALNDIKSLQTWQPEVLEELKEYKKKEEKTQADVADAPPAAQKWLKKNAWFSKPQSPKDIKRQKEAIVYSQILESDGYSMDSEDFFKMVDKRLDKLGLAKTKKSNVESKESSDEGRKTEKRKISQTVQNSSRVAQSKQQNPKKKITLSPEQRKIADLYGISYVDYAKELYKIETSKKGGSRMTTL